MSSFDVRPTSVPQVLGDHQRRIQILEAVPGSSSDASRFTYILFPPQALVTSDAFADASCASFALPSDLAGLGIIGVEAFVQTPSTSGVVEIDVWRFFPDLDGAGQSIFVTDLTIDQDEFTSCTADVPPVIVWYPFDACDYVVIKVEAAGTGTLGLGVHLTFGPEP